MVAIQKMMIVAVSTEEDCGGDSENDDGSGSVSTENDSCIFTE